MNIRNIFFAGIAAMAVTGCGTIQNYNNALDAKQQAYHRTQLILDEQNQVTVNDLKSKQKKQLIEQARSEGEMAKAKAAGDASAEVERAKGHAEANQVISRSLTPMLVQYETLKTLGDKSVVYLPSSVLLNLGK